MLEANRLILDTLEPRLDGELVDSQVEGRVVVEAGARLERCTVRGPGDHRRRRAPDRLLHRALHRDRRGLPRSSARRSSTRSCCRARRSSDLDGRMESSPAGPQREHRRAATRQPRAYRFMVGDNSEIGIL